MGSRSLKIFVGGYVHLAPYNWYIASVKRELDEFLSVGLDDGLVCL